ncbi:MAG: response regulator [Acidimicrobiales bacterium]
MTDRAIRVLLVDDHALFRAGVAAALAEEPDIYVVGQAADGRSACEAMAATTPDVVLLDVAMPGCDGLSLVGELRELVAEAAIMMLTVSEDRDDLVGALRAGAGGYVLKGISADDLAVAVRAVADGQVFVSPVLAGGALAELSGQESGLTADRVLDSLSTRELDVLLRLGRGLTNREIAEDLHLAEKTIKHYVSGLLRKLQLRSRVEAALVAQRHGLLTDPTAPEAPTQRT